MAQHVAADPGDTSCLAIGKVDFNGSGEVALASVVIGAAERSFRAYGHLLPQDEEICVIGEIDPDTGEARFDTCAPNRFSMGPNNCLQLLIVEDLDGPGIYRGWLEVDLRTQ